MCVRTNCSLRPGKRAEFLDEWCELRLERCAQVRGPVHFPGRTPRRGSLSLVRGNRGRVLEHPPLAAGSRPWYLGEGGGCTLPLPNVLGQIPSVVLVGGGGAPSPWGHRASVSSRKEPPPPSYIPQL